MLTIEIKKSSQNEHFGSGLAFTNASTTSDKDVSDTDNIVDGKKKMGQIMHI